MGFFKQLQNEEFRKKYEAVQPEMDIIRESVDASTQQNNMYEELTQYRC